MILLALDTCDSRGSLALLRDDEILKTLVHEGSSDYSSWILPAVDQALLTSGIAMTEVDIFAGASGPGSFTGVRIGLTTIKAWSEAYGKPIAGVSRLEAMASQSVARDGYIAAFFDAQREQVFGGLYQRLQAKLSLVEHEMVVSPDGFLKWVEEVTAGASVSWVSLDAAKLTSLSSWSTRTAKGETVLQCSPILAPFVGRLGRQRALSGDLTDALKLDAQYVRRSDAEIFWKGVSKRGN